MVIPYTMEELEIYNSLICALMSIIPKGAAVIVLLCSILSLAHCEGDSETDLKLGGWQVIPLSSRASYEEGLKFLIASAQELKNYEALLKVERQVVAGFNYRFTFQTEFGVVEAVVYKDLND